jgi:hypothetical protein
MYAAIMSVILLFPWGLATLTTIGYLRAQRQAVTRVARRSDLRTSFDHIGDACYHTTR